MPRGSTHGSGTPRGDARQGAPGRWTPLRNGGRAGRAGGATPPLSYGPVRGFVFGNWAEGFDHFEWLLIG
eukprot:12404575-Karenia_brevis.AAC.1